MRLKKFVGIFAIIAQLSGCAEIFRPDPLPSQSLLIGYNMPCHGSLKIARPDGSDGIWSLTAAGPQNVKVIAESEPETPEKYFGDDSYLCYTRSSLELHFKSEGGQRYRLHLDPAEGGYKVTAWEGLDKQAGSTREIPSISVQKSSERICRFFMHCDGPFIE